ncbi:MAG: efflux RND transporter periplasmic adaptor subunit [Acidobacteriota bacterium]|jgi:membrane fusion protein (multidrug efflux system)|nr:efflux RND transporter periplasmic adaptor subunit [Acidobacteriota bacterium]
MKKKLAVLALFLLTLSACGGSNDAGSREGGARRPGMGGMMGGNAPSAAVPVQVEPVPRRSISQYLETNGTLEAENEVDIVARTSGPVTEINTEEGRFIRAGQLIARIDEREARNQVAISKVARDEAKLAFDRTKTSWDVGLVSQEAYDTALSNLSSAEAQLESAEIQFAYTEITAPFDALVVTRDIKLAQYVTPGTTLFRISDFTPLLCRIEVPEKDFPRIRIGQPAHIRVEAYPGDSFSAEVARLRPTVDATTGTFTVTLEVEGQGKLRPGMFASVYLQTDTHADAIVIPRDALVLDSLGDTVFVKSGDEAERHEVRLGLRSENLVEVVEGLNEGDLLIVVGQDGLADGTPVSVIDAEPPTPETATDESSGPSPEAVEMMRRRMKERGMSDEEIEQRIQQIREGGGPGAGPGQRGEGGGRGEGMGQAADGEIPPFMAQRIKEASPEELEQIKERMKQFGMSEERINEVIKQVRGDVGAQN